MFQKYLPTFSRFGRTLADWLYRPARLSRLPLPYQPAALLRIIGVALEQRLPLAMTLRAFAEDCPRPVARRVQRLCQLLDEGTDLASAAEQVPELLPADSLLAIRFGAQSGILPAVLRESANRSSEARFPLRRSLRTTMTYLICLVLLITQLVALLDAKILPTLLQLLRDWGVEDPGILPRIHEFVAAMWHALPWLGIIAAVLLWSWWTGRLAMWARRGPWAKRLHSWLPGESTGILRGLELVVAEGRPLPGAISTLARYHHDPAIRQRLLYARNEVDHGASVWDSLQHSGLLDLPEAVVLNAAGSSDRGNWELSRIVDQRERRAARRLQILEACLQPLTVVIIGCFVLLLALAVFHSLTQIMLYLGA